MYVIINVILMTLALDIIFISFIALKRIFYNKKGWLVTQDQHFFAKSIFLR